MSDHRNNVSRDCLSTRYQGHRAVLSTKHDKLSLVAPPFRLHVGMMVEVVEVDTDQLGTFTGDIARGRSAWDTAVAKARLGMRAAHSPIGIASEGSIGPHPDGPFINYAVELVVVVDDELGIALGETETSFEIMAVAADVTVDDDIEELFRRGRFPSHAMAVRPADGSTKAIYKGIHSRPELIKAVAECVAVSSNRQARVETDLRAHCCPSRRPIIARAAERLALRLASCCPQCDTPGWGIVRIECGLPCEMCGTLVTNPRADVFGCAACSATVTVDRAQTVADPVHCDWCDR